MQFIINKIKAGEYEMLGDGAIKVGQFELMGDEVEVGFKGKEGFDVASESGVVVALDTYVTEELKKEAYARDLVRYIQDLRKEANYNVDDRIYVMVKGDEEIMAAINDFADYIKRETLAIELQESGDMEWDKEAEMEVEGKILKVAVRKG